MKTINLLEEMRPVNMDPVKEVNTLLEKMTEDERDAIRNAGFKISGINHKVIDYPVVNKVYDIHEIQRMCEKYDFKFLETKHYKGTVPPTLGGEIVKFKKDKRINPYRDNFRLLAPRETFHKEVVSLDDPILFYDLGDDLYEVVHQWGKDMTWKRRIFSIWNLFSPFRHIKNAGHAAFWPHFIGFLLAWGIIAMINPFAPTHHRGSLAALSAFVLCQLIIAPIISYLYRGAYFNEQDIVLKK